MSLHSSLKTKSGALNQHRNVLTRAERIAQLADKEAFVAGEWAGGRLSGGAWPCGAENCG